MRPKNKNMAGPKELLKQEIHTCLKHAFHILSLLSSDHGQSSLSVCKGDFLCFQGPCGGKSSCQKLHLIF